MTYFDLAYGYYKHLDHEFKSACEIEWFNVFAPECAQVVEKLMKAILELKELPENVSLSIFDTHDLMKLSRVVNRLYPNTVSEEKAAWLSHFYFDSRYPGDNCFAVTEYDARQVKEVTEQLSEPLIMLYNSLSTKKTSLFGGNE